MFIHLSVSMSLKNKKMFAKVAWAMSSVLFNKSMLHDSCSIVPITAVCVNWSHDKRVSKDDHTGDRKMEWKCNSVNHGSGGTFNIPKV